MRDSPRVAIYGSGRTGSAAVDVCVSMGYDVVAGVTHDAAKAGLDLGAITVGRPLGVKLTTDLEAVVERADVDVLLYTGITGDVLLHALDRCTAHGIDFVTASMIDAAIAFGPAIADRLAEQALSTGSRVLGTGVNPGFFLDVLPAALATTLPEPVQIRARRVTDIAPWGESVLRHEVGIGGSPESAPATFVGTLEESLTLLADAVGVVLDRIERSPAPVIATARRDIGGLAAEAGQVEGLDHRVRGFAGGRLAIELSWYGIADPLSRGIAPGVDLRLSGPSGLEITAALTVPDDPFPGTAARMVKSVRMLRTLPAGIYGPGDLPVRESRRGCF